jgi:hypothetical protein
LSRVALFSLTVALALAIAGPGVAPGASLPPNRPQATKINPRLLAHFALLRQRQTTQDTVPSTVFSHPSSIDLLYGVNPRLSRRAVGPSSGTVPLAGMWLVAGNNSLCSYLPVNDGSGLTASTCIPSAEQAATKGTAGTTGGFGGLKGLLTLVHGVMPDDVKTVTIRRRTGTTVTVPVRHNVFLKAMTRPNRVFYTIAGKRRSLKLLAPCDNGHGVC